MFSCLPSRREVYGISGLEGFIAKKPVLATNVDGFPEVCDHKALLVEPTITGLSEGINKLLSNEELMMKIAREGHEHVQKLSWVKIAEKHIKLFEDIKK